MDVLTGRKINVKFMTKNGWVELDSCGDCKQAGKGQSVYALTVFCKYAKAHLTITTVRPASHIQHKGLCYIETMRPASHI